MTKEYEDYISDIFHDLRHTLPYNGIDALNKEFLEELKERGVNDSVIDYLMNTEPEWVMYKGRMVIPEHPIFRDFQLLDNL